MKEELEEDYIEMEEISFEDALNVMCGPLVRDQNGNEVTDPKVLRRAEEFMKGIKRFDYGGEFKKIKKDLKKKR